jgi:hypothetical protein
VGEVSREGGGRTYAQYIAHERSAPRTELDYPKGFRAGGHPSPNHPERQHLAKHLADLRAGDKVAAGAKDGVRGLHVVAVDGVGEAELHVGRKGQRTRGLWGVSESDWRSTWTDLDTVGHELFDFCRCMVARVESSPLAESCESHVEQSHRWLLGSPYDQFSHHRIHVRCPPHTAVLHRRDQ